MMQFTTNAETGCSESLHFFSAEDTNNVLIHCECRDWLQRLVARNFCVASVGSAAAALMAADPVIPSKEFLQTSERFYGAERPTPLSNYVTLIISSPKHS